MMKLFRGMFLILEAVALAVIYLIVALFLGFLGLMGLACFGAIVYAVWWVLALVLGKVFAGIATAIITVYSLSAVGTAAENTA